MYVMSARWMNMQVLGRACCTMKGHPSTLTALRVGSARMCESVPIEAHSTIVPVISGSATHPNVRRMFRCLPHALVLVSSSRHMDRWSGVNF